MKFEIIFLLGSTILGIFTSGNALKCYKCTTILGIASPHGDNPGCSPNQPMNDTYLVECGADNTYCNIHRIDMTITTQQSRTFEVVRYELKCASVPDAGGCAEGIIRGMADVTYSKGCHQSCQADGCNRFPNPSSARSHVQLPSEFLQNSSIMTAITNSSTAAPAQSTAEERSETTTVIATSIRHSSSSLDPQSTRGGAEATPITPMAVATRNSSTTLSVLSAENIHSASSTGEAEVTANNFRNAETTSYASSVKSQNVVVCTAIAIIAFLRI